MKKKIMPYYQPIIALNDKKVYSYETLGRYDNNGNIESLGNYFRDASIPVSEKAGQDNALVRMALERYKKSDMDFKMFFNLNPSWNSKHNIKTEILPIIQLIKEMEIDASNIVIEISSEELSEDYNVLSLLVKQLKTEGCKISVDNFYFNNLIELLYVDPDYVKFSIRFLKNLLDSDEYKKFLRMILHFSNEMDVKLVFEGIETKDELDDAIISGGNYFQGFLFSKAQGDFQNDREFIKIFD